MQQPIGIFDSGVGGTSIWKEIHQLMPNENTVYLADSKNAPYGEKPTADIKALCDKNTKILLDKGAKIIVVACNTATTNAIEYLRNKYPVPFIGIEPAIKPAALHTKTKKVGVLATKGTLSSSLFHNTSKMHAAGIEVFEQEGKGLVELVEAAKHDSKEALELLTEYVQPMLNKGIDCLVLGCTHYPYLIPLLKKLLPKNVQIIDSGYAVARQTENVMAKTELLNNAADKNQTHDFYTNGKVLLLDQFVGTFGNIRYLDF